MARVFISYRREDSAAYAGRIQDRLERELGSDLLFIDVDGIPLGVNFVKVLREEVAQCGVLLAMIGPNWLDVRHEDGTRRLDNPTDFVRIEIAAALQREIPVIPILLDGTMIPKADQLPEDLKELTLRHGLNVRHASFHADLDKLILELKRQVGASGQAASAPIDSNTFSSAEDAGAGEEQALTAEPRPLPARLSDAIRRISEILYRPHPLRLDAIQGLIRRVSEILQTQNTFIVRLLTWLSTLKRKLRSQLPIYIVIFVTLVCLSIGIYAGYVRLFLPDVDLCNSPNPPVSCLFKKG
jgi:hypothetical protein